MLTYRDVTIVEFAFARSFFNMIGSSILVKFIYKEAFFSSIPRVLWRVVILRCICGTVVFLCAPAALFYVPLGICFVVFNASVFITALLAYFCLSERMSCFEIIAMIFAFGGILLLS